MRKIPMDTMKAKDLVSKLTVELDEALRLLKESEHMVSAKNLTESQSLPSNLLDQCLVLCKQHYAAKPEPIRTVHHFACSGGTLISKCIASMPNIQLLSEVDPLSTLPSSSAQQQFTPTDMVALMRQSTRGISTELIINIFLNNLETIYSNSQDCGLRLVLRDHAHSHYCTEPSIPERPNLLGIITTRFPALSIVTVRDPIDSYVSLKAFKSVHFSPPTFDEYCARYVAFIRSYEGSPVVRYEDFVNDPSMEMFKICNYLDLPYNPNFSELFGVHRISGDSGRSGDIIEARPRRSIDTKLLNEIETSTKYQDVRSLLGYS
jgi:Sulfotransferase family